MIFEHKIPPHLQACKDIRKETFAALMDLYENNFLRLKKLIPHLKSFEGESVSMVVGCLDLHLSILEQSKFTTLLSLSYYFDREKGIAREPDLQIRIYHDVGLAEVLSGQLHHGRLSLTNIPDTAIMERWHLNRFLYKWLGFSLHLGHSFDGSAETKSINTQINRILSEKI
ncbi:MAG: DUF1249 domain-containing protein [Gammaproteobacteria bacterium]|nr:DUF1249 domain-containing protein [Gammaproteobacteria bacterium]